MLNLTIALSFACLALQDPPKPHEPPTPQEPPKPQDPERPQEPPRAPKPGSALDPELLAAVQAFQRIQSCRFDVEGQVAAPWTGTQPPSSPPRDEKVARAKDGAADGPTTPFRFEGISEREQPLQINGDALEAFRAGDRVVYRPKGAADWSVTAHVPVLFIPLQQSVVDLTPRTIDEPKPEDPKPLVDPAKPRGEPKGGDLRLIPIVAGLPAPHELLDPLEKQVVTCTRIAEDAATGAITFECVVRVDGGPRTDAAPNVAASARLRIVVVRGQVDAITLLMRPPLAAATGAPPPPAAADLAGTNYQYKLTGFDSAHVEVPEEAARLLKK